MMFGLFLAILDIRDGWSGVESWDEAIWSAAFWFVGVCGIGAIVWSFPILSRRGHSLSQIAKSNRRPRQSFAEMIHTDVSDAEMVDEPAENSDNVMDESGN